MTKTLTLLVSQVIYVVTCVVALLAGIYEFRKMMKAFADIEDYALEHNILWENIFPTVLFFIFFVVLLIYPFL